MIGTPTHPSTRRSLCIKPAASPWAVAAASTIRPGRLAWQNDSAASASLKARATVQPPSELASRSRIFRWVALSSMMTISSDDTAKPRVAALPAILGKLHGTQYLGVPRSEKHGNHKGLCSTAEPRQCLSGCDNETVIRLGLLQTRQSRSAFFENKPR